MRMVLATLALLTGDAEAEAVAELEVAFEGVEDTEELKIEVIVPLSAADEEVLALVEVEVVAEAEPLDEPETPEDVVELDVEVLEELFLISTLAPTADSVALKEDETLEDIDELESDVGDWLVETLDESEVLKAEEVVVTGVVEVVDEVDLLVNVDTGVQA